MSKGLEYIRDISYLILENYSDKEPLTEEQKLSKNCFLDYCKYIEKELQRLEAIDNANPSEALECLEKTQYTIQKYCNEKGLLFTDAYNIGHWLSTIKQTLIKAQELKSKNKALLEENSDLYAELTLANKQYKELIESTKQYQKVLDIIKEKNINMFGFKRDIKQLGKRFTYKYYQSNLGNYHSGFNIQELTEEEFELLKRYLEND